MTAVLVDSSVILDLAKNDPNWADWSERALRVVTDSGRVVINAIIFAEVSASFATIEELDELLPPDVFEREHIPFDAAFLAAKAHIAYRRRGGLRSSPLPDFFIGAHAAVTGYRLLTRDAGRVRTYFPEVELITPQLT